MLNMCRIECQICVYFSSKLGLIPDALLSSKRLQTGLDALGRKIGPEFRFAIPHQGAIFIYCLMRIIKYSGFSHAV